MPNIDGFVGIANELDIQSFSKNLCKMARFLL